MLRRAFFFLIGSVFVYVLSATPAEMVPISNHFNGKVFFNPVDEEAPSLWKAMKWFLFRKTPKWTPVLETKTYSLPPPAFSGPGISATFVNHSTVLIQMDGVNILTDPIWSERCSPISFLGPKRIRPPGIPIDALPSLDAVLISHDHYDHLDVPTLKQLVLKESLRVFSGLGTGPFFKDVLPEAHVTEMDWWDCWVVKGSVRVCSVPAAHWSGRTPWSRNRALWSGFVIEGPSGRVLFAGDTGYGPHFKEIKKRFGAFDLAFLPIGAYLPSWLMRPRHMNPGEAVQAALDIDVLQSIGIHFGTFPLADDGQDEPIEELARQKRKMRRSIQFDTLGFGETRVFKVARR